MVLGGPEMRQLDEIVRLFGACVGQSQWAHEGESKRCHTRRQDPDVRHTTAGTMMLCRGHHDAFDGRRGPRLRATPLSDRRCDGPLRWSNDRGVWEEPAA